MARRTLLRGGCVLTLAAKSPNYNQADVLIEGDRIAEVGPGLRARDADVIDATDSIVMPGFVDTHRHVWQSLFCSLGDPADKVDPPSAASVYGPHHQADDIYASTLIGLLRGVESGITSMVDWFDAGDEHTEAALQAHADAGVRTVFVKGASSWVPARTEWGSRLKALAGTGWDHRSTTLAAGAPDPTLDGQDTVVGEWALARELGLRIHAHVGHDSRERGAVAALASRQLLSEDVTLVHCTHLSDSDLDAIATTGAAVALTPSTDMAGGVGSPPLQRLIDRKIRPGLGVDGERITPGDMFAQIRAVISLQHASFFDLKLAGKGGLPRLLTTRDVIRWATVDGARVAGLGSVTGSLEPGRQADVIVLRADRPNIAPVNDPIGAVVWGMDTSNVDWVIVGGRVLMRQGVLEGDVDRVRELAMASRDRVVHAAGRLATAGGGW